MPVFRGTLNPVLETFPLQLYVWAPIVRETQNQVLETFSQQLYIWVPIVPGTQNQAPEQHLGASHTWNSETENRRFVK